MWWKVDIYKIVDLKSFLEDRIIKIIFIFLKIMNVYEFNKYF